MEMKKLLALGFLSLFIGSQANANFIKTTTGSDLAGIEVTVTFADDGSMESGIWAATGPRKGEANNTSSGQGWGLMESGDTLGGLTVLGDPSTAFGIWSFYNWTGRTISSLFIDTAATNIVFDTEFFDVSANGSGAGREFTYDNTVHSVKHAFSGLYMDELYTGLTIFGADDGFQFMADTDLIKVSAPATLSLMLLALGGLVARRRKA